MSWNSFPKAWKTIHVVTRGGWKPVPACIAHHIYYQFPVTRGHCSTSSRCVNMAYFRTDRGNKATDLNGSDHLYVHCVSKERLELLPADSRDVVCRTRMLSR